MNGGRGGTGGLYNDPGNGGLYNEPGNGGSKSKKKINK